jgi:hypothetical protein
MSSKENKKFKKSSVERPLYLQDTRLRLSSLLLTQLSLAPKTVFASTANVCPRIGEMKLSRKHMYG